MGKKKNADDAVEGVMETVKRGLSCISSVYVSRRTPRRTVIESKKNVSRRVVGLHLYAGVMAADSVDWSV